MANSKRLGPSPVIKLYDSDGTVLSSGTVETYITGTSTPKNSYSSSAGAGSATSFTLDSNGEAVRYFDADVAYKLIIKDSGGTTVRTVDPYTPIPAPFQLDNDLDVNGFDIISSSNGNITITPNGTGSIVLDGLNWPQADGTSGQVIQTDGAAQLSFVTPTTDVLSDTSPQLGGNLDGNGFGIQFDTGTGIQDDSGNEQLYFTKTATAVNYINVTNAATGNGPTLASAGSDSNIDLNINATGTGNVVVSGLSYPNSDGSANQVLSTNGSASLSFSSPTSLLTIATQSVMETATATDSFVCPGNMHYHPAMPKAWVVFQIDGTIDASYNCSSITDTGTGDWTVNWSITMSSANYGVMASAISTNTVALAMQIGSRTTTTTQVRGIVSTTLTDPSYGVCVMIFGDI